MGDALNSCYTGTSMSSGMFFGIFGTIPISFKRNMS